MPDDPLEPFLADASIDPGHIGPDELGALSKRVTRNSPEEFILHPTRMPGLIDDQERPPDYFEIHDREWWIDARRPPRGLTDQPDRRRRGGRCAGPGPHALVDGQGAASDADRPACHC